MSIIQGNVQRNYKIGRPHFGKSNLVNTADVVIVLIELSLDLRKDVSKVPENCRNKFLVQRVFKVIFRKQYGVDEKFL